MDRRRFVGAVSLAALSVNSLAFAKDLDTTHKPLIKPKKLLAGSRIGVIAPATNVSDPDDLQKVYEVAKHFGFKLELGKSISQGAGFRTKSRSLRLDDLHSFFRDKNIDGIICIRGGYGSGDLLDSIDYDLISRNPKVFVGYSDITAMHLAIQKYSGLVTFHGPVMLSAFTDYTSENFRNVLFNNSAIGTILNPQKKSGIRELYPTRTIKSGIAKGRLTGGNLSLISSLMGTKYEIDCKGKILFIEDVGEEPFRIDRMMTQLRLSGKLQEAAGIIIGNCSGCEIKSSPPIFDASIGDVFDKHLAQLDIPSFYGLMIGHTSEQITLPMSINAEIDADKGTISILESAVV